MSGALVVAEHRQGELRDVTFELITAGRQMKEAGAGPLAVAILSHMPDAYTEALDLEGVDEIIHIAVAQDEFNSDVYRQVLTTLLAERNPTISLLGFTVDGMCYGPAIAAALATGFASDVVACSYENGRVTARREYYGGKVQADLQFPGKDQVVLMLRPTVWARAEERGSPRVTTYEPQDPWAHVRSQHVGYVSTEAGDVDISLADFIMAIGRGIGEKENVSELSELAERIGATLGCSRPLVDAGWLPASRQIGQSGSTVRPKVYLGLGISGAVQHLVGMQASGTIIAINSDPEAAIFNVAHYGAVADLFEVAEALEGLS